MIAELLSTFVHSLNEQQLIQLARHVECRCGLPAGRASLSLDILLADLCSLIENDSLSIQEVMQFVTSEVPQQHVQPSPEGLQPRLQQRYPQFSDGLQDRVPRMLQVNQEPTTSDYQLRVQEEQMRLQCQQEDLLRQNEQLLLLQRQKEEQQKQEEEMQMVRLQEEERMRRQLQEEGRQQLQEERLRNEVLLHKQQQEEFLQRMQVQPTAGVPQPVAPPPLMQPAHTMMTMSPQPSGLPLPQSVGLPYPMIAELPGCILPVPSPASHMQHPTHASRPAQTANKIQAVNEELAQKIKEIKTKINLNQSINNTEAVEKRSKASRWDENKSASSPRNRRSSSDNRSPPRARRSRSPVRRADKPAKRSYNQVSPPNQYSQPDISIADKKRKNSRSYSDSQQLNEQQVKPFACTECSEVWRSDSMLDALKHTHRSKVTFYLPQCCPVCGSRFLTKEVREAHQATACPIKCITCPKDDFLGLVGLRSHYKYTGHGDPEITTLANDSANRMKVICKPLAGKFNVFMLEDFVNTGQWYCPFCGIPCNEQGEWLAHAHPIDGPKKEVKFKEVKTEFEEGHLLCCWCDEVLHSKSKLQSHVSAQHEKPYPFSCHPCKLRWKTISDCMSHSPDHPVNVLLPNVCLHDACNARFTKDTAYKRHVELKHPRQCKKCHNMFKNTYALIGHLKYKKDHGNPELLPKGVRIHKDLEHTTSNLCEFSLKDFLRNGQRACPICGEDFPIALELVCHKPGETAGQFSCIINKEQKETIEEILEAEVISLRIECKWCPVVNTSKRMATEHSRTHAKSNPFYCELCKTRWTTLNSCLMHEHQVMVHLDSKCTLCNARFASSTAYLAHDNATHAGVSDVDIRDKSDFKKPEGHDISLDEFLQQVQKDCVTCGTTFPRLTELFRHTHVERPRDKNRFNVTKEDVEFEIVSMKNKPKSAKHVVQPIFVDLETDEEEYQKGSTNTKAPNFKKPQLPERQSGYVNVSTPFKTPGAPALAAKEMLKSSAQLVTKAAGRLSGIEGGMIKLPQAKINGENVADSVTKDTTATIVMCKLCGEKMASRELVRKHHMEVHKDKFPIHCIICDKRYGLFYHGNMHLGVHQDAVLISLAAFCVQCGAMFANAALLQRHHTRQHPKWTCPRSNCDRQEDQPEKLFGHQLSAHLVVQCRWCNNDFSTIRNYKQHVKQCGVNGCVKTALECEKNGLRGSVKPSILKPFKEDSIDFKLGDLVAAGQTVCPTCSANLKGAKELSTHRCLSTESKAKSGKAN